MPPVNTNALFSEEAENSPEINWEDALDKELSEQISSSVEVLFQEDPGNVAKLNLDTFGDTEAESLSIEEIDFELDVNDSGNSSLENVFSSPDIEGGALGALDDLFEDGGSKEDVGSDAHFEITEQEKAILAELSKAGGDESEHESSDTGRSNPPPPSPSPYLNDSPIAEGEQPDSSSHS